MWSAVAEEYLCVFKFSIKFVTKIQDQSWIYSSVVFNLGWEKQVKMFLRVFLLITLVIVKMFIHYIIIISYLFAMSFSSCINRQNLDHVKHLLIFLTKQFLNYHCFFIQNWANFMKLITNALLLCTFYLKYPTLKSSPLME